MATDEVTKGSVTVKEAPSGRTHNTESNNGTIGITLASEGTMKEGTPGLATSENTKKKVSGAITLNFESTTKEATKNVATQQTGSNIGTTKERSQGSDATMKLGTPGLVTSKVITNKVTRNVMTEATQSNSETVKIKDETKGSTDTTDKGGKTETATISGKEVGTRKDDETESRKGKNPV